MSTRSVLGAPAAAKGNPAPTAVDLFSGCGGLTEGLKLGGFRVIAAVENEPLAAQVYRLNHPEVTLFEEDIQKVVPARLAESAGIAPNELTLLAGCPPCQGFSTLRTMNGHRDVADERNDLVFEFVRFAKELRPLQVMLENVPALLDDARLEQLAKWLRGEGYTVRAKVLDVADYGVPQRRRRLVMLASRSGAVRFAPVARRRRTVRDAISYLKAPGESGDPVHDQAERRSERVRSMIAAVPVDGGSRADLGPEHQLACHIRIRGFRDVYGRMAWDSVAPTLTTGCYNPSKGRFLHPEQDRAITMREASLLQSFRADYVFPGDAGRSHLARLIGNALPPEFVRRHAQALRKLLPS